MFIARLIKEQTEAGTIQNLEDLEILLRAGERLRPVFVYGENEEPVTIKFDVYYSEGVEKNEDELQSEADRELAEIHGGE